MQQPTARERIENLWSRATPIGPLLDAYRDEIRREIVGDDANPSNLVIDASAYRYLSDGISATMADSDRWDGDESEEVILLRYVQHLAAVRPSGDR